MVIVRQPGRMGKEAGHIRNCTPNRHLHNFWTVFRLFNRRFALGGVMAARLRRLLVSPRALLLANRGSSIAVAGAAALVATR